MKAAQVNGSPTHVSIKRCMIMPARLSLIASMWLLFNCAGCQMHPQISFRNDVYPVLEENCKDCHTPPRGKGYRTSGLDMKNFDSLMKGTVYGPVIIPGNSNRSILNMLVERRADTSMRMPHNEDESLTDEEIRILHLWVSQGAKNN